MIKQYPLPLPHKDAMAADDFMITSSNQEAAAWLDKWPAWPAHCLVLHGPSGSGKTHLLHVWCAKSKGMLITREQLLEQNADQLAEINCNIALDNADQCAGDAAAEEALFHLYNFLRENKGHLLLASVKAPAQWMIKLPDLRSRLLSIQAIPITAPDDDLITALIIKQFKDRQIDISMDVVNYLLSRVTRTPQSVRETVQALDRASLSEGRGITVALARKLLEHQSFPNSN
ncbi:MAG: DnaA/Hda family protein [Alphaproteobacteria bacterium]